MRRRNPSMATWISLGLGGLVGYGVYRAVAGASSTTPTQTFAGNVTPQNVQNAQFWAAATNTQVAAGDAQGNAFASNEKAIRDADGITAQGPNAVRIPSTSGSTSTTTATA